MRRLFRVLRVALLVVTAVEAFYLVAANAALLFVPGLINRTPERLLIHFRAFSPIPGCVFVRDFSIRSQDRFAQWHLGVGRALVWVDLSDLRDREFHVRKVSASGVSFLLRRKLSTSEVTTELVSGQPRIEGFGPVGLRQDREYLQGPAVPKTWTIRMDDVNAKANQVWLDTLKYDGAIHARGAWSLHLDREAWVGPATVELEGGTLSRGELALGSNVRGHLEAKIDTFDTRQVPGDRLIDFLDVRMNLQADFPDVGGVARMLGASKALGIQGEAGRLELVGRMQKAQLEPGTTLVAVVPVARMKVGALTASGSARTVAKVTEKGGVSVDVKGERLSLVNPKSGAKFVRGGAVHLTSWLAGRNIRAFKAPRKASLTLRGAQMPRLTVLNEVIPEPLNLEVEDGSGRVDGKLVIDLVRGVGSGGLKVRMKQVALRQAGDSVRGDVDVDLTARGVRPDFRKVALTGSRVSFKQMKVTSRAGARPWSGEVRISNASLDLNRREAFRGVVDLHFQDARPLFRALLERTSTPRWATKLVAPNRVDGRAELGFGKGWVRVEGLDARVGRTHVTGVARLTRRSRDGAARISVGFLSAGVELRNGHRRTRLLPSRGWFERQQERVNAG